MKNYIFTAFIVLPAIFAADVAMAQSQSQENVYMRRAIRNWTGSHLDEDVPDVSEPGVWMTTAWTNSAGCGQVTDTRQVWCERDGLRVGNEHCTGEEPETTRERVDGSYCPVQWVSGEWSDWSNRCSDSAIRKRDVTCQNSLGETVDDSRCEEVKPDESERSAIYDECTFKWKVFSWKQPESVCTGSLTRTVSCHAYRGTVDVSYVAPSYCTDPKPATEGEAGVCSYDWSTGAWGDWSTQCGDATRTRSVKCVGSRSNSTETVSDEWCVTDDRPIESESNFVSSSCDQVLNSSFENGLTGWSFNNGSGIVKANPKYLGDYLGRLPANSSVSQSMSGRILPGPHSISFAHYPSVTTNGTTFYIKVDGVVLGQMTRPKTDPTYVVSKFNFVAKSDTVIEIGSSEGLGFIDDVVISTVN